MFLHHASYLLDCHLWSGLFLNSNQRCVKIVRSTAYTCNNVVVSVKSIRHPFQKYSFNVFGAGYIPL